MRRIVRPLQGREISAYLPRDSLPLVAAPQALMSVTVGDKSSADPEHSPVVYGGVRVVSKSLARFNGLTILRLKPKRKGR